MTTEPIASTEEARSSASAGYPLISEPRERTVLGGGSAGPARCADIAGQTLPKPYYQDAHATIYHADNRELLPLLKRFDLLLTDPPYGIGESSKKVASRGKLAKPKDYGAFDWDAEPVEDWVMLLARRLCRWQIIFGGNYYALPPAQCWLVWDKEQSGDFADAELAWTNLPRAVRLIRHMWNGMIRQGGEAREHPTQKPLRVMNWALDQAGDVQTVLDPWMGSGTSLFAAKLFGKTSVGIEREERYCEVAANRLAQGSLFAPDVAGAHGGSAGSARADQAELSGAQGDNAEICGDAGKALPKQDKTL
jgi:hypothetical protein